MADKIFKNCLTAAGVTVVFEGGIGVISSLMFIRMYMMLTFWVIAFVYVNYLIWENRKKWYLYALLMIITVCGFMTQYYFALFAIGCYITEFVYDIIRKKYISLAVYSIMMMLSVVVSSFLWKEWRKDLLENVHSQSMIDKTKGMEGTFFKNISKSISYLYGTSFRKIYLIAFIVILVGIIFIILSKKIRNKYNSDIRVTLIKIYIAANFNALVITEMAPDYLLSNRYYYAPSAMLLFILLIMIFMAISLINNKKIFMTVSVCAALAMALFNIYTIKINNIDYYTDAQAYDSRIEFLEQYKDIPWIISGDEDWIIRGHLEFFMIPENVILINKDVVSGKDEILENADEILVFGFDEYVKSSDIGINYYVKCTGNDYTEETIMSWDSLYVNLIKKQ